MNMVIAFTIISKKEGDNFIHRKGSTELNKDGFGVMYHCMNDELKYSVWFWDELIDNKKNKRNNNMEEQDIIGSRLTVEQAIDEMDDFFGDMRYEIPWNIIDKDKLRERLIKKAEQKSEKTLLTMYMVKNKEGKYYRFKGRDGYGETWVSDIKRGKLYNKISPARAVVTFFVSTWPQYGIPDIVELHILKEVVLQETERVEKVIKKKKEEKAKYEIEAKQRELEKAQKDLETAKERLKILQK